MTYNFDPDRWYENERDALEMWLRQGKLTCGEFKKKLDELDQRYDEMSNRLDGTYQLPQTGG